MATRGEKIERYEHQRKFTGPFLGFSVGAFANLIPFLNIYDIDTITQVQWVFLVLDAFVFACSLTNYIYCSYRIHSIEQSVVKKPLS